MNVMDYSLLVGIHDVEKAENEVKSAGEEEEDDEEGSSGGDCGGVPSTPPESPHIALRNRMSSSTGFDPTIDIYAIHSKEGREATYKSTVLQQPLCC